MWELTAGSDIPHYMEIHLSTSDYILMLCTENYVKKANEGKGGVGYEKMIITSNLMTTIVETKIIPLVRQKSTREVPTFLKSKMYIDFSKTDEFEIAYDNLIRAIHKSPIYKKPIVGNNPFILINNPPIEPQNNPTKEILKFFIDEYNKGEEAVYFDDLITSLKISRAMLQFLLTKMQKQKYIYHYNTARNDYYSLKEEGINYAVTIGLVKN